jgi:hypothetical protein
MARHKEKDDEAGGEGLGVLATRKRLWRDANGNIVNARRPSYTQDGTKRRQPAHRVEKKRPGSAEGRKMTTRNQAMLNALPPPPTAMSRHNSATSSTIVVDTQHKYEYPDPEELEGKLEMGEDGWLDMNTLPSPPLSSPSLAHSPPAEAELSDLDGLYEEAWPLSSSSASSPQELVTPTWTSAEPQPFQTFMGAMAELPYDDIFKPESGMYDWQQWNGAMLSRCREEKYEPVEERRWSTPTLGHDSGFRRAFGLGTC